ncbi:MAG: thiol-disulfide oxidoreductase DCC family protein [Chitinophagales bacterium]|nr:thiol-disulfide oxidoreductase DCC family protein [Chitinophagales bacterium]
MSSNKVILFDGVCNLCNSSVQFVIKHDKKKEFSFASLQSDFGQKTLQEHQLPSKHFDSFILLENGVLFQESTAALKVAARLNFPINMLSIFILIPAFLRNAVYKFIANNRYKWFGKKDFCMMPSPELKERFIA